MYFLLLFDQHNFMRVELNVVFILGFHKTDDWINRIPSITGIFVQFCTEKQTEDLRFHLGEDVPPWSYNLSENPDVIEYEILYRFGIKYIM